MGEVEDMLNEILYLHQERMQIREKQLQERRDLDHQESRAIQRALNAGVKAEDIAEHLDISVVRVYQLRSRGALPTG